MNHKSIIQEAFETGNTQSPEVITAIEETIMDLDSGKLRVCTQTAPSEWTTHEWIKKSILLYFKIKNIAPIDLGGFVFVDKIPLKHFDGSEGVRVVPHALVRYGSFVEKGSVLMPSYVNIGAYVGSGTMVDTWATVGSCAQIGKNVHLSGGVGIGGVLEPVQASPVIIEDDVFVGSRCIVVEGIHVKKGAVLGAGVTLTASTRIIDVTKDEPVIHRGTVPEYSVLIPGTTPKKFPAGEFGVSCALIIGKRTEKTDQKTSLTKVLREFNLQ